MRTESTFEADHCSTSQTLVGRGHDLPSILFCTNVMLSPSPSPSLSELYYLTLCDSNVSI